MKKLDENALSAAVGGAGVPLPRPRPFGDVDSLGNFVPGRANMTWNDLTPGAAESDANTRAAQFLSTHPAANLVAFDGRTTNGNIVMGAYSREDLQTDQLRADTGRAMGYDGFIGRDANGQIFHDRPDTVSFGPPAQNGGTSSFDDRFFFGNGTSASPTENGGASNFNDRFFFGNGSGSEGGATRGLGGNEAFGGSSGNDAFGGSSGNDAFGGSSGNDAFGGSSGNDAFGGSSGNDAFGGSSGNDAFGGSSFSSGNDGGGSGSFDESGFDSSSGGEVQSSSNEESVE
ncbi:MAG: hypothetical protein U0235_10730 [Polyangiaceae bacterium]